MLFGHDGLPWFVVGDLEVVGIVDVLVRTLAEWDLHHVLFALGQGFAARHAVLETESPTLCGYFIAALAAKVMCSIVHVVYPIIEKSGCHVLCSSEAVSVFLVSSKRI